MITFIPNSVEMKNLVFNVIFNKFKINKLSGAYQQFAFGVILSSSPTNQLGFIRIPKLGVCFCKSIVILCCVYVLIICCKLASTIQMVVNHYTFSHLRGLPRS